MQTNPERLDLRAGDLVEVRSAEEILATLDERGRLEALPFMPEMLKFTGERFRVQKRAFKGCDQIDHSGMHRMERAVHLDGARCDGQAHGGCQAGCLIYWKEGWLRRVETGEAAAAAPAQRPPSRTRACCTLETLERETRPAGRAGRAVLVPGHRVPGGGAHLDPGLRPPPVRRGPDLGNARLLPLRGVLVQAFNKYQKISMRLLPQRLWIHGGAYYRSSTARSSAAGR